MRVKPLLYLLIVAASSSLGMAQTGDAAKTDAAKNLGAYLGKWQSEATRGAEKITAMLECRWSPQGVFLICEQSIKMAGGDRRQLTIYSYNSKDSTYSYVTIAEPGAKPTSGKVEIKGSVWTYPFSYENNGKTIQVRTTNEFTGPRTEIFKTESSDDGGATWKTVLEGTAHKVGD